MDRFSKQILLEGVGQKGQNKAVNAKLLVVGVGGIGSPLIRYLASSGIGNIDIVDDDIVEECNLPRQNNFFIGDIDHSKIDVTQKLMLRLNPKLNITSYSKRLDRGFLLDIVNKYDYIIDASDNFKTKFICNDVAHQNNKIFISGSFVGYKGYLGVYKSGIDFSKPCFRCFHPEDIDNSKEKACYNQGVLSAGVGVIGTFMAAEIFKEITEVGKSIAGKLMIFDFFNNQHRMVRLSKKKGCVCHS